MPPSVVAILREAVLIQLSMSADLLGRLTAAGRLEESGAYRDATSQIDAARNVLDQLGILIPDAEGPIELELNEHSSTAYSVVRTRLALAIQAVEDAEQEGRRRPQVDPELEQFVAALKRELEVAARRERMPVDG